MGRQPRGKRITPTIKIFCRHLHSLGLGWRLYGGGQIRDRRLHNPLTAVCFALWRETAQLTPNPADLKTAVKAFTHWALVGKRATSSSTPRTTTSGRFLNVDVLTVLGLSAALCSMLAALKSRHLTRTLESIMPHYRKFFPSTYINPSDLDDFEGKRIAVQIRTAGSELVRVPGMEEKEETKLLLYFHGAEKGLICNRTSAKHVARLYGDDTDNWKGHWITLYIEKDIKAFGEVWDAVWIAKAEPDSALRSRAKAEELDERSDEEFDQVMSDQSPSDEPPF